MLQTLFIHSLICIGKLEHSSVQEETAVPVHLHGKARQQPPWGLPTVTLGCQCCRVWLGGRKEGIM